MRQHAHIRTRAEADTTPRSVDGHVDQEIRFCQVGGSRVAIGTVGRGPPLVLPAWWATDLETDWRNGRFRSFVGALAREHTVIRYDRVGTGLSDRERPRSEMTLDAEVDVLEAVLDELGIGSCALFGVSCGGCTAAAFAATRPERVDHLVLYASYANGRELAPADVRASMLAMVTAHWGLGSRMLAEVFMPDAKPPDRRAFANLQRAAASPAMASALLELVYSVDVDDLLPHVSAPTLVMHRRWDRVVRPRLGRYVASRIPEARFVPLAGGAHLPWHGAVAAVTEPTLRFIAGEVRRPLSVAAPEPATGPHDLSDRETEILRLVATGLSDRQIADALILSPHTVHRHVANIRTKLCQPNRAAAAAEAMRLQLI